jgi:pimeloyl-ACP methyl ester carboxylesterase
VDRSRVWKRVRRVWVAFGLTATAVFTVWSLIAYQASAVARQAARGDGLVSVRYADGVWRFNPATATSPPSVGFLFFPGSLVDPVAYAPLLRAVAREGYPAVMLSLPRRGAFGGAEDPVLMERARAIMQQSEGPRRWVVAGHSRGAVVTSQLAATNAGPIAGLVLIGSSHPRDVSLASLAIPVTKIVGTRDGLATPVEVEANRAKLPPTTRWVWIDGGNHSQFGWYGFQPGDRLSRISAEAQRRTMVQAVLGALRAARRATPRPA